MCDVIFNAFIQNVGMMLEKCQRYRGMTGIIIVLSFHILFS